MAWQLEVIDGPDRGLKAAFGGGAVSIGRDAARCGLVLSDGDVSRLHARASLGEGETVQLEDLGSTHGTFVNETRINAAVPLHPEDAIRVGNTRLRLVWAAETAVPRAQLPSTASISIGRDPACNLVINHPKVSRNHARIDRQPDGFSLTDLDSAHGTYLDGRRIKGTVALNSFSWVQVCGFNYSFNGLNLLTEQGAVAATLGRAVPAGQSFSPLQVLAAPFTGRGWLKWLLGSLLAIIPVADFLAYGYRCRLLQNVAAGEPGMPEWENWGELFLNGLLLFLVKLLYLSAPAGLSLYFLSLIAARPGTAPGLQEAGLILSLLCLLLAGFFLPMGWAHFAATGRFSNAFQLGAILARIKVVAGRYVAVTLLLLAAWLLLGVISLIPLLGIILSIPGVFYIQIIFALLFGELYRASH